MTVSYTAEMATASSVGCFLKLLARWRGSIYKLIWKDLFVFLAAYYALNLSYRFCLNEDQQETFEQVVNFFNRYNSLIPLSFVLGFYVSVVISRWWRQWGSLPGTSSIAIFVKTHLHGEDVRGRLMRRSIMRYICLSLTIVLTMIAPRVKKRFPTLQHLITAGLLLPQEEHLLSDVRQMFPSYSIHWMPITWAVNLVARAREEERIRDDFTMQSFIQMFNSFRQRCDRLLNFDAVTVPLVYTQVVTLTVFLYFCGELLGLQWTHQSAYNIVDLNFPLFGVLEYFFYVGWLKVAETLVNPFGDDDDDFEVNYMVDKNLRSAYIIVDKIFTAHPTLIRDVHWDAKSPGELPYRHGVRRDTMPDWSTSKLDPSKANKGVFATLVKKHFMR